jgi:hypothetical protein
MNDVNVKWGLFGRRASGRMEGEKRVMEGVNMAKEFICTY